MKVSVRVGDDVRARFGVRVSAPSLMSEACVSACVASMRPMCGEEL